jgi:hypothetical protein
MKQGKASISGPYDRKAEPVAKAVNPGAVSYLGAKLGNHSMEGDMTLKPTPWDAGRGYMAPSIGKKRYNSGSQGSY